MGQNVACLQGKMVPTYPAILEAGNTLEQSKTYSGAGSI